MTWTPRASLPRLLCCLAVLALRPDAALAAYGNYNSILIGERTAGMGGAGTALTGDAAAAPFYNPALLARAQGSSLSASVSVYNKYDTHLGSREDFDEAPQRVNRGFFRSLPASSGSVLLYDSFAVGLSIVLPDYDAFSGQLVALEETASFLSYVDESLWVGGSFSANLTSRDSVGVTVYYTARSLIRTVSDRLVTGGTEATLINEEKNVTNNSIVWQLGYFRKLNGRWSVGTSLRLPSIRVSGTGNYVRTVTQTSPFDIQETNQSNLKADLPIPTRIAVGAVYEVPGRMTLALDTSLHGSRSYDDVAYAPAADRVHHRPTWNVALGLERPIHSWLRLRLGLYTNNSSHPRPDPQLQVRQPEQIDMWGWSANLAIFSRENVAFTFGGYYTGGRGESLQLVRNQLVVVPKSQQVFTMLVGTSYQF